MTKTTKRKGPVRTPTTAATYASADERAAKGKTLRDTVPRASHAGWKSPKGRRDPVELPLESNKGRVRHAGLDKRLGPERMLFNARAAIDRHRTLPAEAVVISPVGGS